MDIEHLSHTSYRTSVVISIVLSGMLVTLAALLGRGTLNLRSSLIGDEPTDVTVIAVLQEKLTDDVGIRGIDFLRKEKRGETEKPFYAYQVKTSDDNDYLVKIGFDTEKNQWVLQQFSSLHGDPVVTPDDVESGQETGTR